MFIAFAALAAPLAAQEPASLHPAGAEIVFQVHDVQGLIGAYTQTAIPKTLVDAEVHAAIGRLMGAGEPVDPVAMLMREYEGEVRRGDMPPILDILSGVKSASVSLDVAGGDLFQFFKTVDTSPDEDAYLAANMGLRLVIDFVDEPAAEKMSALLDQVMDDDQMPDGVSVRTRVIEADGGDAYTVQSLLVDESSQGYVDPVSKTIHHLKSGSRLALTVGNVDAEAYANALSAGGMEESSMALLAPGRTAFGELKGTPMMEGYLQPFVEQILMEEGPQFLPALDIAEGLIGPLASMVIRGGHWRVSVDGDQFVTQGLHAGGNGGAMAGLVGVKPLDASALSLSHPDALVTTVTSLDTEVLAQIIEALAAEQGDDVLAQIEEAFGFNPRRDIAEALGGAISYSLPSLGSLLSAPNLMGAAQLKDREAFIRGMDGLMAMAETSGGDVQVQRADYRGAMMYTVSLSGLFSGLPMGDLPIDPSSFFKPTITVMDGRVMLTTLPTHAKREIRRVAKLVKKGEVPQPHAGISAMGVPEGASTVGYADWPTFFGNLYTQLKSLAPVLAGFMGGGELPVNVEELPDAELLTRHFRASERWVRQTGDHVEHYSRSSIGPEVIVGPLLAAGVAAPMAMARSRDIGGEELMVAATPVGEVAGLGYGSAAEEVNPDDIAIATTYDTLIAVSVAIRLYELDHNGNAPAELSALLATSASYPKGYLESGEVPTDAWGNAFVYAAVDDGHSLWSTGPNATDDGGQGDDVTLD